MPGMPGMGGMDMGSMMNNPAMRDAMSRMMADPQIQSMVQQQMQVGAGAGAVHGQHGDLDGACLHEVLGRAGEGSVN